LANLRADSEKTRARAESLAQMAVSGQPKSGNMAVNKPMPLPPGMMPAMPTSRLPSARNAQAGTAPNSAQNSAQWGLATAELAPITKASGTIRIGDETLDVAASTPPTAHAQVQWVDSQTRQVARAGSPLSPINVQPATGVLGMPAIPGIMPGAMTGAMPGAMPPGLGQPQ
jgi:hypothetical protein